MKYPRSKIYHLLMVAVLFQPAIFSQTPSIDQQALRRTAGAFEQAGQFERAAEYYSRAVRSNPKDVTAYLGAKRCLDKLHAYDELEKLILELESQHRDLRYRVDLAWVQYKRGDESAADKAWQQVIKENSKSQQTYSLIGQIYVENQRYDEAIELYRLGRKNLQNDLAFMYELAGIYQITNEQSKLADEYTAFVKSYPQQLDFLAAELQRFAQNQDNINLLLKTLEKSLKSDSRPHWAIHFFLADIYTMAKDFEKGLVHAVEFERIMQDSDAQSQIRSYIKGKYLYDFATTALSSHADTCAERAFSTIIHQFSDSRFVAAAKIGLANVYTNQQHYEKAIDALQLFVDQNKRSAESRRALMHLGDIAFDKLFDIERAEKAYHRALTEYTNVTFQIETLFRLSECAVVRNDLQQADDYLQRALRMSTPTPSLNGASLIYLAYLEFYRMRPTVSMRYLDDFSNIVFPAAADNVFENDALELTMLLQENSYDSTGLAFLGNSDLLVKQRQYDHARTLLESYLNANPNSPLKSELRLRLVDIYKRLDDFQPAVVLLDSVYADSSSFYRDTALLASAQIYENNLAAPDAAVRQYEKIVIEFPNSIYLETARERIRDLENQN